MIFLSLSNGHKLIILEPANIQHLHDGGTVRAPDGTVELLYTPDVLWLGAAINAGASSGMLDNRMIQTLHASSLTRPPVISLRAHPPIQSVRDGVILHPTPETPRN